MIVPLRIGAVAYDPKVVTIWDGISSYINDSGINMNYVLFSNYKMQVDALIEGSIDIAWNTNLGYVRTHNRTQGRCLALAMRDTDVNFASVILIRKDSQLSAPTDLKGRSLALGSRDSGHAAILPLYFLKRQGINSDSDLRLLRFDLDVGKHGDTGSSELAVLEAVVSGRAEAGAVGDSFWARVLDEHLTDSDMVRVLWTTPTYSHCNFTALNSLEEDRFIPWVEALLRMDYNDPAQRPLMDMEGLKRWVRAGTEGYRTLFQAVEEQGLEEE